MFNKCSISYRVYYYTPTDQHRDLKENREEIFSRLVSCLNYPFSDSFALMILTGDIPPTTGGSTSSPEQLTNEENVAIYLPPSLFEKTGDVGMFFGIYKTATLFPVTEALNSSVGRQEQVFSNILAATVGQNLNISNLDQPITIAFRTQPSEVMVSQLE